jgi:thiamine-phosphate pyrophosphorylase
MADRCLLYYITDRSQFRGDERARRGALLAKVAEAARARVDYIQLREKDLSARELEMLARDALGAVRNSTPLRTENRELRTRLLINSRTDVALAAGADGVHLRADDVAPHEVRQVLEVSAHRPPTTDHFLVAASCHIAADAFRAESENVDFAVFAPVFGKRGTAGTPPAGLAALREACRAKIRVFALGGITIENAASCLEAGAAGIAAIRLFQENKIEDVVRALRAL